MPKSPRFTASGESFVGDDITLASVRGGGATGVTNWTPSNEYQALRLTVSNLSFTGGTAPTVTPVVQTSPDKTLLLTSTPTAGTSPAVGAGATSHFIVSGLDRYTRISYTTT